MLEFLKFLRELFNFIAFLKHELLKSQVVPQGFWQAREYFELSDDSMTTPEFGAFHIYQHLQFIKVAEIKRHFELLMSREDYALHIQELLHRRREHL